MHNIILQRVEITKCVFANPHFRNLYELFEKTLKPGMQPREFSLYYHSRNLQYIDVTFCYSGNELIGFCAAAFYATEISGKKTIIGRAATGILPTYRGKSLPKWALYFKYIRFKLRHPIKRVILTAYVANPIIYAMICKYTAWVWPRKGSQVPGGIEALKKQILKQSGLQGKEKTPFVVKIHFHVHMGEDILTRIFTSRDNHLQFFLQLNPGFMAQDGVLVIIPVSWMNILFTIFRFLFHRLKEPIILLVDYAHNKWQFFRLTKHQKISH